MSRSHEVFSLSIVAAIAVAGCGSATPEAAPVETAEPPPTHHSNGGMGAEAEVGGMNQDAVEKVFAQVTDKLQACQKDAASRIPYVAGDVGFHVKVDHDGKPTIVELSQSTMGDLQTEKCMVDVITGCQFPPPVGGKFGLADIANLGFPALGEVREPVPWSESDMGPGAKAACATLRACKQGSKALSATFYVEKDGRIQSVGFAGDRSAADCAADKLKRLKFNSPGSYAAKVSLDE